jgi:hypothetical protein
VRALASERNHYQINESNIIFKDDGEGSRWNIFNPSLKHKTTR